MKKETAPTSTTTRKNPTDDNDSSSAKGSTDSSNSNDNSNNNFVTSTSCPTSPVSKNMTISDDEKVVKTPKSVNNNDSRGRRGSKQMLDENKEELVKIMDTFNSRLISGRPTQTGEPHPHFEGKDELTHFFDRLIGGRSDHK